MTALTRVLIFAAVLPQSLQRQSLLRAARALRLVLAPGFGGGRGAPSTVLFRVVQICFSVQRTCAL